MCNVSSAPRSCSLLADCANRRLQRKAGRAPRRRSATSLGEEVFGFAFAALEQGWTDASALRSLQGLAFEMSMGRRLRYEIACRLNRLGAQRDYRWTSSPKGERINIVLRDFAGRERTLSLRKNDSDFGTFLQIFEQRQYATEELARGDDIRARYDSIVKAGMTPLIVDAGANVGLSVCYFRDRYPKAKIIAIEPEDQNFRELERRADPSVIPIQAGLANFDGYLKVVDPGLGADGFRTQKADSGVPAIRLATLLEQQEGEPFLLKIDIEGFEADLFDDSALLDRFYVIFFEPHDWMLPKKRSAASFVRAIAALDRDFLISGENIVSIANR